MIYSYIVKSLVLFIAIIVTGCSSGDSPEQRWQVAQQGVYSISIANSGQYVLAGSVHHGGSYWQLNPLERLFDWNHKEGEQTGILASAISHNGLYAATADHRKIVLWNAKTGEPFWLWEAPANIRSMALDNDGNFALLGLDNYEGALFDIRNGGVKGRFKHQGIVQTVDMTPNRKWAMTGGDDSVVKIWDLEKQSSVFEWLLDNQIKVVSISNDGRLGFASSHRGINRIWDLTTGTKMNDLPNINGYYLSAKFNESGDELLTGSSTGRMTLWRVKDANLLKTWKLEPVNPWVNQQTQILGVAFIEDKYRAVAANGYVYEYK